MRGSGPATDRAGPRRAVPALALGLFGVSWAAVLVRLADAPAASLAFWRLLLSALVLAPFLLVGGRWRALGRLPLRDWGLLLLSGLFLGAHLVAWFLSLEYTSVASSTVLVTSHPLAVGLLSAVFLGEKPDRKEWTGLALAVAGGVLVGWGDFPGGRDPLIGDALALVGALFTALYFIAGRELRRRLGLWSYVVPVYLAAAMAVGLGLVVTGLPATGFTPSTWALILALVAGPMLLGHTSFNWALEHVRAYVVSVVVLLEPLGATCLAILLLGSAEVPGWRTAAGGATLLAGVGVAVLARRGGVAGRPPLGAGAREGGEGAE